MTIQDKFNEVRRFVAKCEVYETKAGLKSGLQKDPGISLNYLVYRWIQFVLHTLIMVGAILELYSKTLKTLFYTKVLLYLTSWVLIGNMVQSLLGAVLLTMAYRLYSRGGDDMPSHNYVFGMSKNLVQFYQTMYSVALNFAVFMVFGYWELLGRLPNALSSEDNMMFGCYGFSVFLMLLDLFVVQFPYKMITGMYSLIVMVAYLFITLIHFYTGSLDAYQKEPYVYPGLDWSKPKIAVEHAVTSVLILEIVNCSTLWWLCQMRRYVFHKRNETGTTTGQTTQQSAPLSQHPADSHGQQHDHQPSPDESPAAEGDAEPQLEKSKKKKQ